MCCKDDERRKRHTDSMRPRLCLRLTQTQSRSISVLFSVLVFSSTLTRSLARQVLSSYLNEIFLKSRISLDDEYSYSYLRCYKHSAVRSQQQQQQQWHINTNIEPEDKLLHSNRSSTVYLSDCLPARLVVVQIGHELNDHEISSRAKWTI